MERLQKILAKAGVASRRKCEELIVAGRVEVNGRVCTELGTKVDADKSVIKVDGSVVNTESVICIVLHKPTSYITSVSDPEGRPTVMELVQTVEQRIYPVGRLDYDTSGLLLLTNDGELTNRLLHPSRHANKVYRVTVLGMPDKSAISALREGILLEDGRTSPAEVNVLRYHPLESVIELTIHEGRNRQVRRMMEAVELPVKRLKRVCFGVIDLGTLRPGKWRWLTRQEWKMLYESVGMTPPPYVVSVSPAVKSSTGHKRNQESRKNFRNGKWRKAGK